MHPLLYGDIARQHHDQLMTEAKRYRLRRLLRRRAAATAAPVRALPLRPAAPPEVRTFPTDRKVA